MPSTAFLLAGFLAASGLVFSFNLARSEGGLQPLSTLWAVSVAPVLPFLAACLGMDVWCGERRSGRLAALLTAPVRERDLVFGKFFGVWLSVLLSLLLSLIAVFVCLRFLAPAAFAGVQTSGVALAFFALALQSALWSAVSVATSAFFRSAAVAALAAVAVTALIPRVLWAVLLAWAPGGAETVGEMPLDAHTFDLASGVLSTGTLISYLTLTAVFLFWNVTTVVTFRFAGRGCRRHRLGAGVSSVLAGVVAVLAVALALRLDAVVELPFGAVRTGLSDRTRTILAEAQGTVTTTVFLPRSDARMRTVTHLLRAFRRTAGAQGGCRFEIRTVDPRWDFGAAQRLVRAGIPVGSVVFGKGRRRVVLPLAGNLEEQAFASAVQRVTRLPRRSAVYWTCGHGEASFDDYTSSGASDIARELARDGYRNLTLDLAAGTTIPSDCALIVIAGARNDFGRSETARLDAYLRQGGRLLLLANLSRDGGLASMLSAWGLRAAEAPVAGARTISGTDVVATEFAAHPVSSSLAGTRLILDRPVGFVPSAAVTAGTGADSVSFVELVRAGGVCVAAVLERGRGTGDDLALRPTRLVVIGDALFAHNGSLRQRGNANRDFLLNCVAYLSGSGATPSGGRTPGTLVTAMDRSARLRFVVCCAGAVPLAVLLVFGALILAGRRRK